MNFTAVFDQRFGTDHVVGKFRLSVTTDKAAKLGAPVAADVIALLETPAAKRTPDQAARLRNMYLCRTRNTPASRRKRPTRPPKILASWVLRILSGH